MSRSLYMTKENSDLYLLSPDIWEKISILLPIGARKYQITCSLFSQENIQKKIKRKDFIIIVLSYNYLKTNYFDIITLIKKISNFHVGFLLLGDEDEKRFEQQSDTLFHHLNNIEKTKTKCFPILCFPLTIGKHYFKSAIKNLTQQLIYLKTKSDQLNSDDYEIRRILNISKYLAREKNFEILITLVLEEARRIACADGGSIYIIEENPSTNIKKLRFKRSALISDSDEFLLAIDSSSIAGHVALTGKPLLIANVYNLPKNLPFSFNKNLDRMYNYHTKSMLVIPMINQLGDVMGVLQLINRKKKFQDKISLEDMRNGIGILPFSHKDYLLTNSVANQSAIALYNQSLLEEQKKLLESFIELIASAIDSKSDYTGSHCHRVPIITEMLTKVACEYDEGSLKGFQLSEEEWYEIRIAAGLHDCGKIVTPVHVMDKATKLETIADRIENVKLRFEILRQNAEKKYITCMLENKVLANESEVLLKKQIDEINDMETFIEKVNIGGEFLKSEDVERILSIGKKTYLQNNEPKNLLTETEIKYLSISRGTLSEEERLIINGHMVDTVKMLESLPFPKSLRRVPEYACGHHEKMDGTGYPKGVYGQDMSIPARIMAVADVFEALTATDRPYKKAKSLSETMFIMGKMKENNHFDPEIFDLFITSEVYRIYAEVYMSQDLIDEVDKEALLNIKPKGFSLPPKEERLKRKEGFLPAYKSMDKSYKKLKL